VFAALHAASVTLQGNTNAMSTKYEDNFGFYHIDDDDPEELEFFCHIRAQSDQQYAHAVIRKCDCRSTSKYVQRVHKLLNTVRRQIQPGSFLIFGQLEDKPIASQMPSRCVRQIHLAKI
jgi:hypothetical protein